MKKAGPSSAQSISKLARNPQEIYTNLVLLAELALEARTRDTEGFSGQFTPLLAGSLYQVTLRALSNNRDVLRYVSGPPSLLRNTYESYTGSPKSHGGHPSIPI